MPKFINTPSIQQWNTPLGYDREEYQNKLNHGLDSRVNLYHQEAFSLYSPHTNVQQLDYWGNKVQRAAYIWDSIPELAKFPISGKPEDFSVQYVMVPVTPPSDAQKRAKRSRNIADTIRNVFLTKPYGG